jgi:transposase
VSGVWDKAWEELIRQLDEQGQVNWDDGFADGTFSAGKKRDDCWSYQARQGLQADGPGRRNRVAIGNRRKRPQSCQGYFDRAAARSSRHAHVPSRLIYDRAADSDPPPRTIGERGIELICPDRRGRKRPATQDGRPLRRYRKRWIVERTIGWLHAFRRLVTRYEFYAFLFHSFAKLACRMIVLRRF